MGFSAYDNALGFANAFRLLFSRTSIQALSISRSYFDASMIMPTIVNGALSCELFIKSLLKSPPKEHKIIELLSLLEQEQPGIKKEIQAACIELMRSQKEDPHYDTARYEKDMQRIDNAFYHLRYWHEPRPDLEDEYVCNMGFLDVLVALLQKICEERFGPRPSREVNT